MIAGTVPEDGKKWISENPYIALHESGTWLYLNFDGNVDREKLAIWSLFFSRNDWYPSQQMMIPMKASKTIFYNLLLTFIANDRHECANTITTSRTVFISWYVAND